MEGRAWSRSPSTKQGQISAANASGKTPVVFVHGLWLLPSSWDRWRTVFEEAGYSTLAPGWPDDPETVAEANRNPEVFAGKSIKDVADHFDDVIRKLDHEAGDRRSLVRRPADPDPGRPRPVGGVGRHRSGAVPGRAAAADLGAAVGRAGPRQPAQPRPGRAADLRAVPVRLRQRRQRGRGARAVRHVRGARAGRAALPGGDAPTSIHGPRPRSTRRTPTADRCSSSMASSTTPCPGRSRMPRTTARSATPGVTEIAKVAGRGHALTIDSGWRDVADLSLAFIRRFVQP